MGFPNTTVRFLHWLARWLYGFGLTLGVLYCHRHLLFQSASLFSQVVSVVGDLLRLLVDRTWWVLVALTYLDKV